MSKGIASVAGMVLNEINNFGLVSTVPFPVKLCVKFHAPDEDEALDPEVRGVG